MLVMKGTRIPARLDSLRMANQPLTRLYIDGVVVWEVYKKKVIFNVDGNFTMPSTVRKVTICGIGGGGGGSTSNGMGGASGNIVSNLDYAANPGDIIPVVIGSGGSPNNDGDDCSFGGLNISGGQGAAHAGEGARRDTCGGTFYDGLAIGGDYGGQAGIRSDGGAAHQDGTKGAGGGSGGRGGSGLIIVSYYLEDQS